MYVVNTYNINTTNNRKTTIKTLKIPDESSDEKRLVQIPFRLTQTIQYRTIERHALEYIGAATTRLTHLKRKKNRYNHPTELNYYVLGSFPRDIFPSYVSSSLTRRLSIAVPISTPRRVPSGFGCRKRRSSSSRNIAKSCSSCCAAARRRPGAIGVVFGAFR